MIYSIHLYVKERKLGNLIITNALSMLLVIILGLWIVLYYQALVGIKGSWAKITISVAAFATTLSLATLCNLGEPLCTTLAIIALGIALYIFDKKLPNFAAIALSYSTTMFVWFISIAIVLLLIFPFPLLATYFSSLLGVLLCFLINMLIYVFIKKRQKKIMLGNPIISWTCYVMGLIMLAFYTYFYTENANLDIITEWTSIALPLTYIVFIAIIIILTRKYENEI